MSFQYINEISSPSTHQLLALLRCPACKEPFHSEGLTYDVLRCRCSEYPVVFGIPVLARGAVGFSGWTAERVIHAIKSREYREALEALTLPPAPKPSDLTRRVTQRLSSMRGMWRLSRYIHEKRLHDWKMRARQSIDGALNGSLTAAEYLKFHFCDSGLNLESAADYFIYKFLQPRNMVALSLAETLQNTQGFILDLCCGAGHICFGLEQRFPERTVVGIDRSFPMLFVARNWTARRSAFVCCDLSLNLPFRSAAFGGVVCNDAFHYFKDKPPIARECLRVLQEGGVLALEHVRTTFSEYDQNSCPLAPVEYTDLMADVPCVMLREFPVMARYLQQLGPDLSATEPGREEAPTLSIVASRNPEVFKAYGEFEEWPHGRGPLLTNPLYRRAKDDSGRNVLELHYTAPPDPSMSLQQEHRKYGIHLEERVPSESLERLPAEDLVGRFLLISAPDRFYRSDPVVPTPRKSTGVGAAGIIPKAS